MKSPQKKSASKKPAVDKTSVELTTPEDDEWNSLGATRMIASAPEVDTEVVPSTTGKRQSATAVSVRESQLAMSKFGDYQLIRKLGQGAMATVYKARQISFDRKVALKLLHKSIAENPKLVERFYREARVMGQLDHPNIVQGYGVGEVNGIHYFAMEYVRGQTLQQWLNKLGRLSVDDALSITLACARALEYAHEHGLIHRDIKPDNILITRQGDVKVADLGMVKLQDEDMSLTQTGHAVGTPWYMPMEQARNAKDVDGRSDIYALGCTLHCMLTGKPPFMGANIIEVIKMKEIGTFPPARQSNPDVPERLDLIIGKMTAKQPKYRYANCTELIRDLEAMGVVDAPLSFHKSAPQADDNSGVNLGSVVSNRAAKSNRTAAKDVWYLRIKTDSGVTYQPHSTAEIVRLVQAGEIPPSSKVSRSETSGFRALATYKEFRQVTLALAAKDGADRKAANYRSLYKEIEEQDLQRQQQHQKQEAREKSMSDTGRIGFIITATIIGSVLQLCLAWWLAQRLFS